MDYQTYVWEDDPIVNVDPQETLQILAKLHSQTLHFNSTSNSVDLPSKPSENFDPTSLIQDLSDNSSDSEGHENSEGDEYVYIIQDPNTGEEVEIASGDLLPGMGDRQLYYDPIKQTLLASPIQGDMSKTSIIDQLNYEDNIAPPDDLSYSVITDRDNIKISLTGEKELIRILGKISRQISRYNAKAHIYRILNYIVNIGSIVVTSTIGFLLATDQGTSTILSIMAFSIAIIKGIHELLKLGSLGIIYKGLAIRLQSIFREVQEARDIMVTDAEKLQYAGLVLLKLSEMDLETFKASYGPRVLKDSESEDAPMVGGMNGDEADDDQLVNVELDPELEVTPAYVPDQNNDIPYQDNDIPDRDDNIPQPTVDDIADEISGNQVIENTTDSKEEADLENQMI